MMSELQKDLNRMDQLSAKFADRVEQHLPHTSDPVLIVLKGHLLIEEIITESLCLLMHYPQIYFKTNPNFYTKVCLLKALIPLPPHFPAFDAVLILNNIRNKLAHYLEYPEIENLMETYLKNVEDSHIKDENSVELHLTDKNRLLEDRIRSSIYFLVGELSLLSGLAPILNKLFNKYDENGSPASDES